MTTRVQEEPQWRSALDKGNHIRIHQAKIKREIGELPRSEGLTRVAAIIEEPDEFTGRLKLERLLQSVDRVGPASIPRLMRPLTRHRVHLEAMTDRERKAMASHLRLIARGRT